MKMKLAIVSAFLTFALCPLPSALLNAQGVPVTEVFLAPLSMTAAGLTVGAPVNVTNNPGYDNQPSFLPDSSAVLFASNRDGKQNDIYKWDIAKQAVVQLTRTAENDYSPLVAPDGKSFICVHGTEQSLFRYDLDGSHPRLAYQHGTLLIGYHVWITDTEIAAFILGSNGSPNSLQVIDTTTGNFSAITSNVGRSLLMRPGHGTVSFVTKLSPQSASIKQFDVKTHDVSIIVADTLKASEDLTWMPDGNTLIMGQGSKLSAWTQGLGWSQIADFTEAGVTKITRLAASPNGKWLAIVGEPAK